MALVAAAFVPTPPLLVPELAAGSAEFDEPLRQACGSAVAELVGLADFIVVVGGGLETGVVAGSWDWRGFGLAEPAQPPAQRLPLTLGIGAWLLHPRAADRLQSIAADMAPASSAALGEELASAAPRVGLLVCGDGSARRSEKAPGHFDERAAAYDAQGQAGLADADPQQLLALEPALGAELMVAGRAAWQVAAGAARASAATWTGRLLYADAPYGVFYAVASWRRQG